MTKDRSELKDFSPKLKVPKIYLHLMLKNGANPVSTKSGTLVNLYCMTNLIHLLAQRYIILSAKRWNGLHLAEASQ